MKYAALVLCSCALSSRLPAQDFNTVLETTGLTFNPGSWRTTSAANSKDGVDALASGIVTLVQLSPNEYFADFAMEACFTGPRVVTWWQRAQLTGWDIYSSGGFSSFGNTVAYEGDWRKMTVELTPPFTLRWSRELYRSTPATYTDFYSIDQVTESPLPSVSVDEALDSPGWSLSAPGAWQGVQSTRASDGADYVWMTPGAPGPESWLEHSFTGPIRVIWKWRQDSGETPLRVLVDGAAVTPGGYNPGAFDWQTTHVDLGPGMHTLRLAVTSPLSGRPSSIAFDTVTAGPVPGFAEVLDTPGRTWVPGGTPLPVACAAGAPGERTYVAFNPAPGQESWLETSVTGPAMAVFLGTAAADILYDTTWGRVAAAGMSFSLPTLGYYTVSIPAGTHTLRMSCTTPGMRLDNVSITTPAVTPSMIIGAPSWPLLAGGFGAIGAGAGAGGGLEIAPAAQVSVVPDSLDEPARFSVNVTGDHSPVTLRYDGKEKVMWSGSVHSAIVGGGQQTLTFSNSAYTHNLRDLTRTVLPRVAPGVGLDTAAPLATSSAGQVLGIGGAGSDGTDCVWLQSSPAGKPAWIETTVSVPAAVSILFRGQGSVFLNGVPAALPAQSPATEWTPANWQFTGPVTLRWQSSPADRSGLFLDALTIVADNSLDAALERPGWTTGGARAWTYFYDSAQARDYAAPPSLLPGEHSWIETDITGPFEFTWSAAAGDSLQLEIDGDLRADTALPSSSPIRVQLPAGATRRCRWIAVRSRSASGPSPASPRLWTVDTSPDTRLAQIAQSAFALTESVFWADGWIAGMRLPHGILPGPGFSQFSGTAGLYCSGSGTVRFDASVTVSIPNNLLHDPGSATLDFQGGPVAVQQGESTHPVTASGLSCVVWNGFIKDVIDTNGALSVGEVTISNIRWLPGNTAWRTWAAARGLTGFAADTTADPDHDGFAAGLEYLLGTNPFQPGIPLLTLTSVPAALRLTALKPSWPTPGSLLRMETSADLTVWAPAAPAALIEDTSTRRTWQIPATAPRAFARLTADITPD